MAKVCPGDGFGLCRFSSVRKGQPVRDITGKKCLICDHEMREAYFGSNDPIKYDAIHQIYAKIRSNNPAVIASAFERLSSPAQVMTALFGGKYCEGNQYGLVSPCMFNESTPGAPAQVHNDCRHCIRHCFCCLRR